ncbi:uncharacterized protein [Primulina huaijiensis]|uniref:uncharacterized protein n=1 Tax=Primulina huaijiensis TaxID=1492673 RepID=UPI003CC767A4
MAPSQMEDGQQEVQDPLGEINLGGLENPKVVYVSKLLEEQLKQDLINMLKEYKDCFTWSYDDMPGLDRKLVEHRLPLKEGFKPFQHPSRRMSKEVELNVKEEVEKLLKAKFIKPIRYTEWLSSVVPVMKKNGKRGVEVDKNKEKAIMEANPPKNKKELQRFLGYGMALKLYISAAYESIGCLLVQNNHEENEQAIYYLSRFLTPVKADWQMVFSIGRVYIDLLPPKIRKRPSYSRFFSSYPSLDEPIGEQAEYEVLVIGLEILKNLGVKELLISGDFQLVLESTGRDIPHGLKMKPLNYVLVVGDLYRKDLDGLLLRYIGFLEALEIMKQVHEVVGGAHQSGVKMRWLIRRYGYYWPSILKDCIKYAKGCQPCQKHGNIQRIPPDELHSVVTPWPFKGWAMDLIGKIYPASSKGHSFILVATDFFTKWVGAVPLKKAKQGDVIKFVKENIIHRFGIPESLTTVQGTMFTGSDTREFAADYGIKLINSSPHYPQSNGQVEASNKVLIKIL